MAKVKSVVGILLILLCFQAVGQNSYQLKVNESEVPKIVKETFKNQHASVMMRAWYTTHISYWYSDFGNGIYNGWYGNRTTLVYTFEKPNYFVVEFSENPGEISRALYNRYDHWYETRTQLKGLPLNIVEAINKTQYANWKRAIYKEKLESAGWPSAIYRFKVSKGMKSHIVRMDEDGNIIQTREIEVL